MICTLIYVLNIVQIRFASVDLKLHTKYVPGGSESIYDVDRKVSERTQVIPPLPEDRFLCSFSHIFAGLHTLPAINCTLYWCFFMALPDLLFVSTCYSLQILGGYAAGYYSYKVFFLVQFFKTTHRPLRK